MRENKRIVYVSLIMLCLSMFVCLICREGCINASIVYDISMAVLGSMITSFVLGIVSYCTFRRYEMEQFWLDCLDFAVLIGYIPRVNTHNIPNDLLLDALKSYDVSQNRMISDLEIKNDIAKYLYGSDDETTTLSDYSEDQMRGIDSIIGVTYGQVHRALEKYFVISHFSIDRLNNSYGKIDAFIFEKIFFKENSSELYNMVRKLINACSSTLFGYEDLDFNTNITIFYDKVIYLQKLFRNSLEDFQNKNRVSEEFDDKLEKYRNNIYHLKYKWI